MDKINPVAVVGPAYCIAWVGTGPIAPIIQEHGIQIGDSLYSQHAVDTLQYRLDTANIYGLQCDKDISDLLTRTESAEAEADALRKDAQRYRWLRDSSNPIATQTVGEFGDQELDEAIDAYIQDSE